MNGPIRALRVLSLLETISVTVLLANLFFVGSDSLSRVLGPVHGSLYLAVLVTALFGRGLRPITRVCAVLPVLSGPLTMFNLRREGRA